MPRLLVEAGCSVLGLSWRDGAHLRLGMGKSVRFGVEESQG